MNQIVHFPRLFQVFQSLLAYPERSFDLHLSDMPFLNVSHFRAKKKDSLLFRGSEILPRNCEKRRESFFARLSREKRGTRKGEKGKHVHFYSSDCFGFAVPELRLEIAFLPLLRRHFFICELIPPCSLKCLRKMPLDSVDKHRILISFYRDIDSCKTVWK